jgi:Fur family ferric uptake transcriptional regulator
MRMRNIRKNKKEMKGRPATAQRQLLLNLIRRTGGHISAKDLYRRASRKSESISLATVYRTLKLFKELGLVEQRRLGEVYCHYEVKESADHQHLVCRSCGKVIEFESPLLSKLVEKLQSDHEFNLTKIELYVEGYCKQCEKKAGDRAEVGQVSKMPLDQGIE